ncbi:MAG TPA: RHS repeat-associated core domain-containing protein [Myxococcales bacterium]
MEGNGRTATWQYDGLWRLTGETIAGAAAAGSVTYAYDAVGNRLSRASTIPGLSSQTSTYDANDRLQADAWDENGNTTQRRSQSYGYDGEDHLTSIKDAAGQPVAAYAYDGDGQLVSRSAGGVTVRYLIDDFTPAGLSQVAEERAGGEVVRSYVYGASRIAMHDASGTHYYGSDLHSGVRMLFDEAGRVTDTWDYDAFGNTISRTGTTANEFTYRGEQFLQESSLSYNRARFLDLDAGRFLTADPSDVAGEGPLGLNAYLYADASPVDRLDPTGQFSMAEVSISISIQATIGAIAGVTFNGINNYLVGKRFLDGAVGAAAFGAAALPISSAFPIVGAALAGLGVVGASNSAWQVFTGNSTGGQKAAAIFLVGVSLYGAYASVGNIASNGLWVNVNYPGTGGLQAKTSNLSIALGKISERVGGMSEAMEQMPPQQQSGITYAVGIAEDAAGNLRTIIGTSEPRGYIRPPIKALLEPGDIIVKGAKGTHAEADVVSYANQMGWNLISVGATRPICPSCAAEIAGAGACAATPLK